MTRAGLCGLIVLVLVGGGAAAGEEGALPAFGPVPAALAAVRGSASDEALATEALATLEGEVAAGRVDDALLDARGLLVHLGDVGLRHVAERLARGDVGPDELHHLLHVVSSASHPAADVFLAQAARSTRTVTRSVAADGLGRGRSDLAVETLDRLCRDPVPGVRAAALGALFAIDTDAAARVRHALPVDERPDLHTRRLRWHRVRGRSGPDLLALARASWEHGRTPRERLAAARLLALPSMGTPLDVMEDVVAELGTDALGAAMRRLARGVPRRGYDRGASRLAAILAAFSGAVRGEAPLKRRMVDRMVGWLARPARLDPYAVRVPEDVLRMVLPDWGEAVREPTLRRLRVNGFQTAGDGVDLLLEALSPESAASAFRTLLDPTADPPVDAWVRMAAAGGLRTLQRIGDEALARSLLRPAEKPMIRRHAVRSLSRDDATWALPLLAEILAGESALLGELPDDERKQLVEDAVASLEARTEDAARSLLVDHLFTRATRPEIRMEHLVLPADEVAFDVLERALTDERVSLRRAGLRQLHYVRALRQDERALELLRAYEARTEQGKRGSHEFQQVILAYFALAPREGIRWMRAHWNEFRALDWEATPLRSLQNVPRGQAAEDMVDLVLEKVERDDRPKILQEATTALQGRRGYRDGDVDAFWRRALSHPDEGVVLNAEYSLDHPGHADFTDLLIPLFVRLDLTDAEVLPEAAALLDILRHQPPAQVEPLLLRVAVDANADPTLRQKAAVGLLDRVSDAGRARLLAWLTSEAAGQDDDAVARRVARVVGTGGGEDVAWQAFEVLRRLLLETYDTERSLDPDIPPEGRSGWHIGALARAIAFTRHEPTVRALLDLVFDERFARYARNAVALQGRRLSPVDATSGARSGPTVHAVWHRQDALYAPLPWEVGQILENVKAAPDEMLARGLEAILADARRTGRLATFPDLHLDRVIAHLRERLTGDRVLAAEAVERWVGGVEPVGGATDFGVARERVGRFAREQRYAEAAEAQASVLAILSQRSYDDEAAYNWRRERSFLDAWRGAGAAANGDVDAAEALFAQAVRRHVYDSQVLGTTARARAQTGVDLEAALALAERALRLERRVGGRFSRDNADALALVLLKLQRFEEAAAAIEPVLRRVERQQDPGGRYHLRAAEARLGAGDGAGAREAILTALRLEPSLDARMRLDPWLAPLAADGTLEDLIRQAEEEALEPTIE